MSVFELLNVAAINQVARQLPGLPPDIRLLLIRSCIDKLSRYLRKDVVLTESQAQIIAEDLDALQCRNNLSSELRQIAILIHQWQ